MRLATSGAEGENERRGVFICDPLWIRHYYFHISRIGIKHTFKELVALLWRYIYTCMNVWEISTNFSNGPFITWLSDARSVHISKNPGDCSGPVCTVTLLQQRQESLRQASPIRISVTEIRNWECIPEENGCCWRWVTFVAVLQGEKPWKILRYQHCLGFSYLGCSAFPLILWHTSSILPIDFPFCLS